MGTSEFPDAEASAGIEAAGGGEIGLREEFVEFGAFDPGNAGLVGKFCLGKGDEIVGDALHVCARGGGFPCEQGGAQWLSWFGA